MNAEKEAESFERKSRKLPRFKKVPVCEECGREPAVSFSFFRDADEEMGHWRFVGYCTNDLEIYWLWIGEFFMSPAETVDAIAHLSQKTWAQHADFARMIIRFRKATDSFWGAMGEKRATKKAGK
jgi:hypothetical protein